MKDFWISPQDSTQDVGTFLIRKPKFLTSTLLDSMKERVEKDDLIVSLERLFKGGESALVLYGSKNLLLNFSKNLDLLELEDYSQQSKDASAWEIGVREKDYDTSGSLFSQFPKLERQEQVWYQIVLQSKKGAEGKFRCQIRAAVYSKNKERLKELSQNLQVPKNGFVKIPKPFSSLQIMDFYKKRSIGKSNLRLSTVEIIKLWSLP